MLLIHRRVQRNGLAVLHQRRSLPARYISLTGAIEKGIRTGKQSTIRHEKRYGNPRSEAAHGSGEVERPLNPNEERGQRAENPTRQGWGGPRTEQPQVYEKRGSVGTRVPPTIPYATASSEFIYGTFSVLSALKAKRRKLYNLYRLQSSTGDLKEATSKDSGRDVLKKSQEMKDVHRVILNLANQAGVQVKDVTGQQWQQVFNRKAGGRPHNGLILEASPIPKLPITSLLPMERPSDAFAVTVGWASPEDRDVNSVFGASKNKAIISSIRPPYRYPFMLLLDRITDTGNFGAIARSAWFLGVDAILILEHGTAPVSTNSLKASAGALEHLPILHVKNEREFLHNSRNNGWKFFAADAPKTDGAGITRAVNTKPIPPLKVEGALLNHPCVLILGNEETGIREFMKTFMDGVAGIPNARPHVGDIDSLNVSVAAALLTQRFFHSARVSNEAS